jgi:hypothetical protein
MEEKKKPRVKKKVIPNPEIVRAMMGEPPEEVTEERSIISPELKRLEATIKKIQDAADTINPLEEEDVETRIKVILGLQKVAEGQPKLLMALEELRNKHKLKNEDIKGSKALSPLEDGSLDDDD